MYASSHCSDGDGPAVIRADFRRPFVYTGPLASPEQKLRPVAAADSGSRATPDIAEAHRLYTEVRPFLLPTRRLTRRLNPDDVPPSSVLLSMFPERHFRMLRTRVGWGILRRDASVPSLAKTYLLAMLCMATVNHTHDREERGAVV